LKGLVTVYFIVFERETGKVIGKTCNEEIALSYIENGNGVYDYQSYDDEQ
jgi:hypothetical protein